ncbi:MAG: porin family protein [Chitinophagales bacterium]
MNKKNKFILVKWWQHIAVVVTMSTLFFHISVAQESQVFNAGFTFGGNFTQIDGDAIGGYTKIGLNAGLVSEINLNDSWRLGFELLYSQKGSSTFFSTGNTTSTNFTIALDYIDIPILIKYYDWRGGFTFGAGGSLGRIIRGKYTEDGVDLSDILFNEPYPTNRWDIAYLADLGYMINDVWGVNIRYQYSLLKIRTDPTSNFRNQGQFNNVISGRVLFIF